MHQRNTPVLSLGCRKRTRYMMLVVQQMCIHRLHNIWSTYLGSVNLPPSLRRCLQTLSPESWRHYCPDHSFSMESPIRICSLSPIQMTMLCPRQPNKKTNTTLGTMSRQEQSWIKSIQNQFLCIVPNNWCYCIHSGFPYTLRNNEAQNQINEIHPLWCNRKDASLVYMVIHVVLSAMHCVFSGFINIYFRCWILNNKLCNDLIMHRRKLFCMLSRCESVSVCVWDNLLLCMSCRAVP